MNNNTMIRGSKGKYPYHEGKHLVVALREWVYLDESGIHDTANYCLVAGYRASPPQWERFHREWKTVLNKFHIKDGFHSNVFFNRKIITNPKRNPYINWSDKKASEYLNELLYVIRRRRIKAVGCAIDVKAFNALSFGEQCVLVGYTPQRASRRQYRMKPQPYHLAVRGVVQDSINEVDADTELHFVLAEQPQLQQRALDAYSLTKEAYKKDGGEKQLAALKKLKGIGLESPLDFPGLQAADLYTNRWYHYIELRAQKGIVNMDMQKFMNELTHNRRDMLLVDASGMDVLFEDSGITIQARNMLRRIKEPL